MPDDVYADRDTATEVEVEEVETETETTEDDKPDKKEGDDDGDDKSSESATGLLSKSLFSGKDIKPGYKCSIVVDKIYDDQVAISLAPHDKSKDSEDESEDEKTEDIYD